MENMMKLIKSYILYTISAFGISLGIISSIGVSSFNSLNLAMSAVMTIKIGTMTIFLNGFFLVIYMMLTRFKHPFKYLIQAFSVIMFGVLINIFTYNVLSGITNFIYYQRVLIFIAGTIIGGFSIGGIIHYNMITFPLESVCVALSERTSWSFTRLRYMVDILSVTVSISLSLIYGLSLYVREGTIISMILLSFTMGISKEFFKRSKVTS